MKKINVFSVDYPDDMGETHLGLFSKDDVASHVAKGNGAYNQDAKVTPKEIVIFDSVEEFITETGKKVLSTEEMKERVKAIALGKLTEEEKRVLGL